VLRFYLDEDLSNDLAPALRALGFDVVHTRQLALTGQIDPRQLAFAVLERRTLVTANLDDFRMLHEAWLVWSAIEYGAAQGSHPGIIVVPNPNVMPASDMADLLDGYAREVAPEQMQNRFLRWRRGIGWEDLSAVR
jgi:Domain of unknown function (DUF5615)